MQSLGVLGVVLVTRVLSIVVVTCSMYSMLPAASTRVDVEVDVDVEIHPGLMGVITGLVVMIVLRH